MSEQSKAKRKPGMKKGGKATTRAELDQRIRIVESLVVAGRAQTAEDVMIGLDKAGRPGLGESTCRKYLRIARERLTKDDDKLRSARREILLRTIINDLAIIQRKLDDSKIQPRWSDRVAYLKLLNEIVGTDLVQNIGPELPDDDVDDLEGKTPAELDVMIGDLLQKAGSNFTIPGVDKPEA